MELRRRINITDYNSRSDVSQLDSWICRGRCVLTWYLRLLGELINSHRNWHNSSSGSRNIRTTCRLSGEQVWTSNLWHLLDLNTSGLGQGWCCRRKKPSSPDIAGGPNDVSAEESQLYICQQVTPDSPSLLYWCGRRWAGPQKDGRSQIQHNRNNFQVKSAASTSEPKSVTCPNIHWMLLTMTITVGASINPNVSSQPAATWCFLEPTVLLLRSHKTIKMLADCQTSCLSRQQSHDPRHFIRTGCCPVSHGGWQEVLQTPCERVMSWSCDGWRV